MAIEIKADLVAALAPSLQEICRLRTEVARLTKIVEAGSEWLKADDDFNGGNNTPCDVPNCTTCPPREAFRKLLEEGK